MDSLREFFVSSSGLAPVRQGLGLGVGYQCPHVGGGFAQPEGSYCLRQHPMDSGRWV